MQVYAHINYLLASTMYENSLCAAAFHLYRDTLGMWRWYLIDEAGIRQADSGGYFTNEADCRVNIQRTSSLMPAPVVIDPVRQSE
jgi:uncharacterized protein YegP (UPF0339 family)